MLLVSLHLPGRRSTRKAPGRAAWSRMQLAACVNILPEIRSIYRWEASQNDGEVLIMVKTPQGYPRLELAGATHPRGPKYWQSGTRVRIILMGRQ